MAYIEDQIIQPPYINYHFDFFHKNVNVRLAGAWEMNLGDLITFYRTYEDISAIFGKYYSSRVKFPTIEELVINSRAVPKAESLRWAGENGSRKTGFGVELFTICIPSIYPLPLLPSIGQNSTATVWCINFFRQVFAWLRFSSFQTWYWVTISSFFFFSFFFYKILFHNLFCYCESMIDI